MDDNIQTWQDLSSTATAHLAPQVSHNTGRFDLKFVETLARMALKQYHPPLSRGPEFIPRFNMEGCGS